MVMPSRLQITAAPKPAYATQDDVLEAAKAVRDQVGDDVKGSLLAAETNLAMRLGKTLDVRLEEWNEQRAAFHEKRFTDFKLAVEQRANALTLEARRTLASLRKDFDAWTGNRDGNLTRLEERVKEMEGFVADMAQDMSRLKGICEEGLAGIQALMKSLPTPTVNVQVPEQAPPTVNVQLPKRTVEKSITYDQYGRPQSIIEQDVS